MLPYFGEMGKCEGAPICRVVMITRLDIGKLEINFHARDDLHYGKN